MATRPTCRGRSAHGEIGQALLLMHVRSAPAVQGYGCQAGHALCAGRFACGSVAFSRGRRRRDVDGAAVRHGGPGLRASPGRRGAARHDDGRCLGHAHRVAVRAAPLGRAQRSDRQHHEARDRLDRGQTLHRTQRSGPTGDTQRAFRLSAGYRQRTRGVDPSSSSTSRTTTFWSRRRPTRSVGPRSRSPPPASSARSG